MIGPALRELAALQGLGVTLPEALEAVGWSQLVPHVRAGNTLGQAMERAGFPAHLARVLSTPAGDLPEAVAAAAQALEADTRLAVDLDGALRYARAVAVGLLLLVWALGSITWFQFRPMFLSMSVQFEGFTYWVYRLQGPFLLLISFVLISVAAAPRQLTWYSGWDRKRQLASWLRWVELLCAQGVPLPEAGSLAAQAYPELGLGRLSSTLSAELTRLGLPWEAYLVGRAEALELRPPALSRIAAMLEREVELSLEQHLTLVEPVMLVVLGGVMGLTVVTCFLPLYQLIGNLG